MNVCVCVGGEGGGGGGGGGGGRRQYVCVRMCVCTWVKKGLFIYSLGDCFRLIVIVPFNQNRY